MNELEKLKVMLEDIQASLKKGVISEETFNAKIKELEEKHNKIVEEQKVINENMKVRAEAMTGLEDEKRQFSILAAVRGVVIGEWGDGYEKGIMDEYKKKAMGVGSGGAGGYLVPPQAILDMIEALKAQSVVIQSGATVMDGLTGSPVQIPSQTASATAYWIGENSAITASQLTIGQKTAQPHKCAALVKVSNELIMLSNPGAETLVRQDITDALQLAIDIAALRGSGAGSEPRGVVNTTNVLDLNLGADGARADFTDMDKLAGLVEDQNALRGNLGYIMHPKVKRLLRQERIAQFTSQTDGSYVLLPMSDSDLSRLMAYPFKSTTQIPTNLTKGSGENLTEIYFGNWKDLVIAMWGGLQIATSNVAGDNNGGAFSSDQTWIRAISLVDIVLRHVQSFAFTNEAYSQTS